MIEVDVQPEVTSNFRIGEEIAPQSVYMIENQTIWVNIEGDGPFRQATASLTLPRPLEFIRFARERTAKPSETIASIASPLWRTAIQKQADSYAWRIRAFYGTKWTASSEALLAAVFTYDLGHSQDLLHLDDTDWKSLKGMAELQCCSEEIRRLREDKQTARLLRPLPELDLVLFNHQQFLTIEPLLQNLQITYQPEDLVNTDTIMDFLLAREKQTQPKAKLSPYLENLRNSIIALHHHGDEFNPLTLMSDLAPEQQLLLQSMAQVHIDRYIEYAIKVEDVATSVNKKGPLSKTDNNSQDLLETALAVVIQRELGISIIFSLVCQEDKVNKQQIYQQMSQLAAQARPAETLTHLYPFERQKAIRHAKQILDLYMNNRQMMSLSAGEIIKTALTYQNSDKTTQALANDYNVSRQTISRVLSLANAALFWAITAQLHQPCLYQPSQKEQAILSDLELLNRLGAFSELCQKIQFAHWLQNNCDMSAQSVNPAIAGVAESLAHQKTELTGEAAVIDQVFALLLTKELADAVDRVRHVDCHDTGSLYFFPSKKGGGYEQAKAIEADARQAHRNYRACDFVNSFATKARSIAALDQPSAWLLYRLSRRYQSDNYRTTSLQDNFGILPDSFSTMLEM